MKSLLYSAIVHGLHFLKGNCVMASANVSGISQTLPYFSAGKSNPSPQDEKQTAVQNSAAEGAALPVAADTVSISIQTRQTIINANKEEAKKEDVKKPTVINQVNVEKSDKPAAKVEFVYDTKGDLLVRYMDSSNRLIYQAPSELMQSLREAALKNESVDTKA